MKTNQGWNWANRPYNSHLIGFHINLLEECKHLPDTKTDCN